MTAPKTPVKKSAKKTAKTATQREATLDRAVERLDASNQGVKESLDFLRDVLKDDQKNRRWWRWVIISALVLNFAFLSALSYNSIQGAQARKKLLEQNRVAQVTLEKVDAATNPKAQAEQAKALAQTLVMIKCDNQRNIARAMSSLGAPYELTEECRG